MSSVLPSDPTPSALPTQGTTPSQGSIYSPAAGIRGGYTGNSLNLQIIFSFLIGLSLYNAVELIVLVFVTFNKYKGIYFWSLLVASFGVIPYAIGFLIKFFQLIDSNGNAGYVSVVLWTIGWYMMITGQSVVLWSRLHLVTSSRRVIRWTLYMIIFDGLLLHSTTSVLTFGANSNSLSDPTLRHFVHGYSIIEKIQMVGFFLQELVISAIYIRETVRLLKLQESISKGCDSNDVASVVDEGNLRSNGVRRTMYQLITINAIIVAMDIVLLGVEFANLYIIETTLKGAVYSIKLKLEFAALGKLVQLVRPQSSSSTQRASIIESTADHQGISTGLTLQKTRSGGTSRTNRSDMQPRLSTIQHYPDFVDPSRLTTDVTHAEGSMSIHGYHGRRSLGKVEEDAEDVVGRDAAWDPERERWRRRSRARSGSWIDEEMDKHNIG